MSEQVGVWIVGALGDVATTVVLGAAAIARDLAPTTGLVSEAPPLVGLPTAPLSSLVFGGHDVRRGDPHTAAANLARAGVIPVSLLEPTADALAAYAGRIRPGVIFGAGEVVRGLESEGAAERRAAGPREALELLRADLAAFREAESLTRVVVVALASTEPLSAALPELETLAGLQALIAADDPRVPASVLYAVAAFEEGCAYVNFTPSLGSTPAGVAELAIARGMPHMGRDGKTGQTLLRTALAPMFVARNFQVMSWAGFNILGNRDGEVLDEPGANAAKTTGKDKVLSAILGDRLGTSLTRIDYVPSLGDWKTAWDHVHFAGFLGTQMQLEMTWRGADSALAAPLVLDLVRLIELAQRRGRSGLQTGLASFFKTPEGVAAQALPEQLELLERFAAELAEPS
ncbi:MAG: inositol-3-phosphate synthase [Planctomycetes bacterium]|nr:inositol-3-phosphate synthase [Planctomycetota bacterium]